MGGTIVNEDSHLIGSDLSHITRMVLEVDHLIKAWSDISGSIMVSLFVSASSFEL